MSSDTAKRVAAGVMAAAVAAAAYAYIRTRRRPGRTCGPTLCYRHRLDARCGFLAPTIAQSLPPHFRAWETVCASLASLNRRGRLRAAVDGMPLLRVGRRLSEPELRRARVMLTYLVHSYVHGGLVPWHLVTDGSGTPSYVPPAAGDVSAAAASLTVETSAPPPPSLPPQLAVPWREVSERLGMPLVLTATDTDLWNHTPLEFTPDDGASSAAAAASSLVGTFTQAVSMTGTESERGFHAVPCALQTLFAPLLPGLVGAAERIRSRDYAWLEALCVDIDLALRAAREEVLPRVYTSVGVAEFYDVYRPLLGAWPHGLRLEGMRLEAEAAEDGEVGDVGEDGEDGGGGTAAAASEVIEGLVGPSAGQTAILIMLDIVLGVVHGPKLAAFQTQMRAYVPAPHRALLDAVAADVAASGSLRDAAGGGGSVSGAQARLAAAHSAAARSLASMRAYHMAIASNYLKAALKGTGESDFRSLLDEGLRSTRAAAS